MSIRNIHRRKREPTITLINIVFLMLIFFMITGTISRNIPEGITLPNVANLRQAPLPSALILYPDGAVEFAGKPVGDIGLWRQSHGSQIIRIMPDRDSKALDLLDLAQKLKTTAQTQIRIVTESARP